MTATQIAAPMNQEYTSKEAKKLPAIKTFRLIGHTNVFSNPRQYKAAGFIPSVKGYTEHNGKTFSTCARIADIIILS